MSCFKPICNLASERVGTTDKMVSSLEKIFHELRMSLPKSKQGSNVAAASAPMELVGNPQLAKNQTQKRKQPRKVGAPTTKTSKDAGRKAKKEEKKAAKISANKAAGRDSSGKRTWGN